MKSEKADYELLQIDCGEPSEGHDKAILDAIDHSSRRIRSARRPKASIGWKVLPLGLAATVLIAFMIQLRQPDSMRGPPEASLEYPQNATVLSGPLKELRWPAQSDASSYRVELRNVDGDVVFSAAVLHPTSSVALPEATRSSLRRGETYIWSVGVEDSLQRELGPFWFSIAETVSK